MLNYKQQRFFHSGQSGFSLVELMVGLVIGLIASLVIMQVFSAFEGQKRSTSGSADAQTNGSIALHLIQRDVQMAGYGLPLPKGSLTALKCQPAPFVDKDGNSIKLAPLEVSDGGGDNGSDVLIIRHSNSLKVTGPVPVKFSGSANPLTMDNIIGCEPDDIVLVQSSEGTTCSFNQIDGDPEDKKLSLRDANGISSGAIACMGDWRSYRYEIKNEQLVLNDDPIVSGIVDMQVQYGITSGTTSSKVEVWVDASLVDIDEIDQRNSIKAIRIVVVARNDLLEKDNITEPCTTKKGVANNGPCAWDDEYYSSAPAIDLSWLENWQRYRYKTFETIIPLRNVLWSKDSL